MTDAVTVALIGAASAVVGSACTVLTARIQAKQSAKLASEAEAAESPKPSLVLGEIIDIGELRILRALYGEPSSRLLQAFRVEYYRPALDTVVQKGWVEQVHGGRYRMTQKGALFCREYLKQLDTWRPV